MTVRIGTDPVRKRTIRSGTNTGVNDLPTTYREFYALWHSSCEELGSTKKKSPVSEQPGI